MATQTFTLKVHVPAEACFALLQKIGNDINDWKVIETDNINYRLSWKWGSHLGMKAPGTTTASVQSAGDHETCVVISASNGALADPLGILEKEFKRLADPFTIQVSALSERNITNSIKPAVIPDLLDGSSKTMRKCPFCAEDIQEAAIVCKHCGRDLAAPNSLDINNRKTVLQNQVQRYQSAGYRMVSSIETMAVMERKAPTSTLLLILLILLFWPAAAIYYGRRKTYRVQLNVNAQGQIVEAGGSIAEFEGDKFKADRTGRLWFGWILTVIGGFFILMDAISLLGMLTTPPYQSLSDILAVVVPFLIIGLIPFSIGFLSLRSVGNKNDELVKGPSMQAATSKTAAELTPAADVKSINQAPQPIVKPIQSSPKEAAIFQIPASAAAPNASLFPENSEQTFPGREPIQAFDEMLAAITPDGPSLYASDRKTAMDWYAQKSFPQYDHHDKTWLFWYDAMAQKADENGIWEEAWAAGHHALAGYLAKNAVAIPRVCWYLGRAQMARINFKMASLYFEAGLRLSNPEKDINLTAILLANKAVLEKLGQRASEFQIALDSLFAYLLSPSGPGIMIAKQVTLAVFSNGKTNHKWLDKMGQPIRSSLILASAYYQTSLEINRKLDDKQGMGFTLASLGDVWRKLGDLEKAHTYWNESLRFLSEIGDQTTAGQVRQWMSESPLVNSTENETPIKTEVI